VSAKMGRPKSDNPKTESVRIRIDADTEAMLNVCCDKLKLSKSEVIRAGIKKVHQSVIDKE